MFSMTSPCLMFLMLKHCFNIFLVVHLFFLSKLYFSNSTIYPLKKISSKVCDFDLTLTKENTNDKQQLMKRRMVMMKKKNNYIEGYQLGSIEKVRFFSLSFGVFCFFSLVIFFFFCFLLQPYSLPMAAKRPRELCCYCETKETYLDLISALASSLRG